MWRYAGWNKLVKWGITAVFAILFISSAASGDKTEGTGAQAKVETTKPTTQAQQPTKAPEPSIIAKASTSSAPTKQVESNIYQVTRVIDGDTIQIEGGKTVRYIGIDTPETKDPRKPVQCFGNEAYQRNKQLVEGKKVRLETDVSETDKYGRLLRYVYLEDFTFVNNTLVLEGFAHASSYPPDVRYQELFRKSEQEARSNNKGLWSGCQSNVAANPTQAPVQQTSGGSIKGNISSSGEKIYHMVGCASYDKTVIDESAGERWFSTEQEAQQAGWRKAGNC
jgi:micrococcal nuclease